MNNEEVFARIFKKQTLKISVHRIDHLTLKSLKRGNRYKLFRFRLEYGGHCIHETQNIIRFLKSMPDIDIQSLQLKNANNQLIDEILLYSKYENREELFKILDYRQINAPMLDEPLQYLSYASTDDTENLTDLCHYVDCLNIEELDQNMNLD